MLVDEAVTIADTLPLLLVYGLVIALAFGLVESAGQYLVSVGLLAIGCRTPWRLLRFLGDAHRRGVLRQQGATYEFRHVRLRERLAATQVSRS
jgi:hypothetical protein